MDIHPTSIRRLQPALAPLQILSGRDSSEPSQVAIRLHIERLIIEGQDFTPSSKNKVAEALKNELSVLFQASTEAGGMGQQAAHQSLVDVSSQPTLQVPSLTWQPGNPVKPGIPGGPGYASELGQVVARVIYHAFTTPSRRTDER